MAKKDIQSSDDTAPYKSIPDEDNEYSEDNEYVVKGSDGCIIIIFFLGASLLTSVGGGICALW